MTPPPVVLIVDDEEICQTIVSAMIKKIGLPTLTAYDGKQAVEMFALHGRKIGCVLMDLQMPNMNGMDACRRIREMDANIPVIFASGYLDAETKKLLATLKPRGYLHKPVGFNALSDLLSEIMPLESRHEFGLRNS